MKRDYINREKKSGLIILYETLYIIAQTRRVNSHTRKKTELNLFLLIIINH